MRYYLHADEPEEAFRDGEFFELNDRQVHQILDALYEVEFEIDESTGEVLEVKFSNGQIMRKTNG